MGALLHAITSPDRAIGFQPTNINWGLFPPLEQDEESQVSQAPEAGEGAKDLRDTAVGAAKMPAARNQQEQSQRPAKKLPKDQKRQLLVDRSLRNLARIL